jgi:superfamily II DNA or RNA helicase
VVDVAIIDEAHVVFAVVQRWQQSNPDQLFIGLSATPWQKGMAEDWDDLIQPTSIKDLISEGMLCPFRAFAPSHPDLSGVHTIAGDYHEGELAAVMSKPKLIGDIVQTWIDRAKGQKTLVFCVNRAHAREVEREFTEQGVAVAYVDALTLREERTEIIHRLEAGDIHLIVSIGTMTTGVDIPSVTCIVYARPTKSEILYVQSIGRGLRTFPGKTHLTILDHSDTTLRLGTVDMIRHESLLSGVKGKSASEDKEVLLLPKECPQCQMVLAPAISTCPNCGCELRRKSDVQNAPGMLRELGQEEMLPVHSRFGTPTRKWTLQDKIDFHGELRFYGQMKGYKPGWASVQYKERLGEWPDDPWVRNARPVPPTRDALGWIKSRQIAWFEANASERKRFREP